MTTQNQSVRDIETFTQAKEERVSNENCNFHDSVAVRISTTAGCWPEEDLFAEFNLDTPIKDVLIKAAGALNIASTAGFIAKECQKELSPDKTFRQSGLRNLVEIDYSKLEKGGGSHPFLNQNIFANEINKLTEKFLSIRNWKILKQEYPYIEIEMNAQNRETLIVTVECSKYPSEAPSYVFRDNRKNVLTAIEGIKAGGFINLGKHPTSNGSFICTPGAREYHTHPSHINDKWDNYRNRLDEYGVIPMLSKIYNFWINGGSR